MQNPMSWWGHSNPPPGSKSPHHSFDAQRTMKTRHQKMETLSESPALCPAFPTLATATAISRRCSPASPSPPRRGYTAATTRQRRPCTSHRRNTHTHTSLAFAITHTVGSAVIHVVRIAVSHTVVTAVEHVGEQRSRHLSAGGMYSVASTLTLGAAAAISNGIPHAASR
jgi:hypothetical protein